MPDKHLAMCALESLHVARRRRAIADLLLTGQALTTREIARHLAEPRKLPDGTVEPGIVNPRTDQPYGHVTIARDIQWLKEEWRRDSIRELHEHKAELLARLKHLYRHAIRENDLREARHILSSITDLLNLDDPGLTVHAQLERLLDEALGRLEVQFGHNPSLLDLIMATLAGTKDEPT